MKFYQACNLLREGKKVRRTCWEKGHYWVFNDDGCSHRILVNSIGEIPSINKSQMEANDWEIFNEEDSNFCLSDEIIYEKDNKLLPCDILPTEKIKRFIKECEKKSVYASSNGEGKKLGWGDDAIRIIELKKLVGSELI